MTATDARAARSRRETRWRLPVDHARENRLTYDDDLFLRARRVLAMPVVNQILWRIPGEVPAERIDAFHRGLAAGPWNRLAVAGRVPGARPRWVRGVASPLRVEHAPVPDDRVLEWGEARAAVRLDPVLGPTWEMTVARTVAGETLLSVVAGHEVCDGGSVLATVIAAAEGAAQRVLPRDGVQVRRRDDLRDALHLTREALGGLRRVRQHRPSPLDPDVLTSDRQAAQPARGGQGARTYRPSTVAVTSDAAAWHRVAAEHGGSANTLLVALVTEVLTTARRVPPGASLKVALPVDTREPGDLRSNATTGVSIVVDTANVDGVGRVRDLAHIRARSKEAFAGLAAGTRTDPLEPLKPLVQLLPDGLVRRLAGGSAVPLCLCSNLGRLPAPFRAPLGVPASAVLMRSVTQDVTPDMMRSRRGGVTAWWNEHGPEVTLGLLGMDPDHWPDAATLRHDVATVYRRWGLEPRFW
ncbi:hypothetical protein [Nocardioides sambongensis]|uniref:hypothetical protein n=1 Tax=Nocardioides sambongensis TaxID=2589074 RepID=UPI00112EE07F|nr:hypothetical protein [Nocardioides sambongensis]